MGATSPPTLPRQSWPLDGSLKFDRKSELNSDQRSIDDVTWKPEVPIQISGQSATQLYPIYKGSPEDDSSGIIASLDAPTPLTDLTTLPGEVQADYSIEFPYNRIHFQSAPAVVSS